MLNFVKKCEKKLKLFFVYWYRIVFVRNHFKCSFFKKIRANLTRGFLADQWMLYDFDHNDKNEYLSDMSIDNIKKQALKGYYTPICATISGYTKMENGVEIRYGKAGTRSEYFENWGLYTSHVYSLLGCYSREDKTYVVLRNPHGRNPNTMSNNTNVYQEYWGYNYGVNAEPEYRHVVDIFRELSGDGYHQNSNGLFLLEINEFKRVFDYITYAP